MMRQFILCFATCLLFSTPAVGEVHRVSSGDAISDLIEEGKLTPGDEIIWVDGVYKDQEIEINGIDGTETTPFTLRAETPGGVVLVGESNLRISGKWWVISGFHFNKTDAGPSAYNAIQFRGSGNTGAENVRLTNCAFTSLDNGESSSKWVQIYGRRNKIDHCHFSGKPNKGALITVELGGLAADQTAEHVIEWNYFASFKFNDGSDNETIRVGFSGDQNKPARCIIRHNLFFQCDGENEIISNKSSYNRYTSNTFRKCNGALVLRHGHHATVNGNFFFGEGATNAGGLRINDSHHRIYNNYMQDLTGLTWNAALSIEGGKQASGRSSNGYQAVEDVTIVHNSIINCSKSIFLNDKHGKRGPQGVVANNLVATNLPTNILIDSALPDDLLGWSQNLFFGGQISAKIPGRRDDPQLVAANGMFQPLNSSPIVDAADHDFDFDFVDVDIDNQPRKAGTKDIGAFEVNTTAERKSMALTKDQVGTTFSNRVTTSDAIRQTKENDNLESKKILKQAIISFSATRLALDLPKLDEAELDQLVAGFEMSDQDWSKVIELHTKGQTLVNEIARTKKSIESLPDWESSPVSSLSSLT